MAADPRILPALLDCTRKNNSKLRITAVGELSSLSAPPPAAIPIFIDALDENPENPPFTRASAAHALGRYGRSAISAKPALEKTTHDSDEMVRVFAQAALCQMQGNEAGAIHALAVGVADPDEGFLPAGSIVLSVLCKDYPSAPATRDAIVRALNDRNDITQSVAVRVLSEGGPWAKALVPELRKHLRDRSLLVRHQVILSLRQIEAIPRGMTAPVPNR